MKKRNTLDKFMVTRLDVKNDKNKVVTLPTTGKKVTIPKLSYRHFTKIKNLKDPVEIMTYLIGELKAEEFSVAETEFLLIHMYYHNDIKSAKIIENMGIDLSEMKISEAKYDYTFDNIRIVFDKPTMFSSELSLLIKEAYDNNTPIELTDENRINLINCLYRYEYDDLKIGVLQEVYIIHKGKIIKGLNIIGE